MLTDTTFWIDLLLERQQRDAKKPRPAHEFMSKHRARDLRISIITFGELAEGFREFDQLHHFLRAVRVLSLPRQIAWQASRIQRELAAHGERLGENDTWIAATALAWGCKLATHDKAFSRVKGLKVVSY